MTNAVCAPEPKVAPAPPLPWKWTKLDPMEAGRRAYHNYLTNQRLRNGTWLGSSAS